MVLLSVKKTSLLILLGIRQDPHIPNSGEIICGAFGQYKNYNLSAAIDFDLVPFPMITRITAYLPLQLLFSETGRELGQLHLFIRNSPLCQQFIELIKNTRAINLTCGCPDSSYYYLGLNRRRKGRANRSSQWE